MEGEDERRKSLAEENCRLREELSQCKVSVWSREMRVQFYTAARIPPLKFEQILCIHLASCTRNNYKAREIQSRGQPVR